MTSAINSYIDDNGKLVIPIKIRKKLNLKPRDRVSIVYTDNKLTVSTFNSQLEKARKILSKYGDLDLLGELKVIRKEEFEKEQ